MQGTLPTKEAAGHTAAGSNIDLSRQLLLVAPLA